VRGRVRGRLVRRWLRRIDPHPDHDGRPRGPAWQRRRDEWRGRLRIELGIGDVRLRLGLLGNGVRVVGFVLLVRIRLRRLRERLREWIERQQPLRPRRPR
jgi:hypothetical protein